MNPNAKLNSLLKEWKPDVHLPARFESEVWRRISIAQDRSVSRTWSWLLSSPRLAVGLVTAMIIFGVGLAVWQANTNYQKQMQAAHSRYLHSVDPFTNVALASNE